MPVDIVFTAIAKDRPGVVEALAEIVDGHSGNWIDSSMARLGGEFAGIVRVAVSRECAPSLEQALAALAERGIDITVHKDAEPHAPAGRHAKLAVTGLDHTGIVLEVTRALARKDVSIDDLKTKVFSGSMGGEAMFSADIDIVLPDDLDTEDLRDELELIANDIMVEINFEDVPPSG